MISIAVVSDTHMQRPDNILKTAFDEYMIKSDILIHCGDMVSDEVFLCFEKHPQFYGVRGNCDYYSLGLDMPVSRTFNLEGMKIGVVHGWGRRSMVGESAAGSFGPGYDLVLYGHTHERDWSRASTGVGGALLLNPGSFTAPRDSFKPGFAILTLEKGSGPEVDWISI